VRSRWLCDDITSDVLTVLHTIGGKELLASRSRQQILTTIDICRPRHALTTF
jgi:hypothetical protein